MKSTNNTLVNGSDLVEIFIKNPIRYFPVLQKNKIIGYIAKKKVLRLATHHQFLEKKISDALPQLLEQLDHELFFEEIEELEIKPIPYLLWVSQRLEIHKKNKEDFFLKHKPVEHISPEDIATMIERHDLPLVAFDGSGKLLMENQAARRIRTLVELEKSPNPYLYWIKKPDLKPTSSGKRKTGNKSHKGYRGIYHLQSFQMKKGMVNLVLFLSFQKRK